MTAQRDPQHDRDDVSGNPEAQFVDEGQEVLRNKKGIAHLLTLQVEEGLALAYEQLLCEVRSDTPITLEPIRHAHAAIFADLYEWAGRWRTVRISKPGASWQSADSLEQSIEELDRGIRRMDSLRTRHFASRSGISRESSNPPFHE